MSLIERLRARAFRLAARDFNGDGAKLATEAADALEKLRWYAIHDLDCGEGYSMPDGTAPCTCGLDALLKEIGGD